MSETSALDMDVRILRRQLNKGFVAQSTVDEMLKPLPDVESMGEYFDPDTLDLEEVEAEEEEAAAADATTE
jgi:hypothetical protein